ncbi:MAG: hypothetical protein OEM82_04110 [Acidobacteriota bacterium]|nr:hypothetical protein [Acidobacteriota bacterium]MDH3529600.1 hypothetical protein [Acidobacteriota bacterium]
MVRRFLKRISTPARITAASFLALIALVAAILCLPISAATGKAVPIIDAAFVATSAVCVVGLTPIDVSTGLSTFGQVVIMIAMQIGGLGLMTFTTVFYAAIGRRLPLVNNLIIQETFHHSPTTQVKQLLFYIVSFTFVVEAIGAILYFVYWSFTGRFANSGETAWHAVFMAITAFTNGGFSLYSDSIVGFQKDYFTMFVTAFLILAGGIGFLVSYELKNYFENQFRKMKQDKQLRLSVHTKITLLATLIVTIIGTSALYFYEQSNAFAGLGTGEGLVNAFFYTVTPRSGGLQSISMLTFSDSSMLLIMVLMFVGAGAGSTGGGIKVGTFGLVLAYMIARLSGKPQLSLWQRTIPKESIDKAVAVAAVIGLFVVATSLVLMTTETYSSSGYESRVRFVQVVFEAISAACTVGLSLDFTSELTNAGKIFLSIVMFVGRLGPLGLAIAITARHKKAKYRYAEENIIIG